ncbi:MAG: ATP-binding protein [Silvanigrellaceae bacterium]
MSCVVRSAICLGLQIIPVTIEAALGSGFSGVQLIGLPQDYAREARERIRAAVETLGLTLPARRLVVSVRPVDSLKQFKNGLEHLDFPCAMAILAALAEQQNGNQKEIALFKAISRSLKNGQYIFAGQLTLSGQILAPEQSLPFELLAIRQSEQNLKIYTALSNQKISLAPRANFIQVDSLRECLQKITQQKEDFAHQFKSDFNAASNDAAQPVNHENAEERTKRIELMFRHFRHTPVLAVALALAAAGRHHILLAGSPGCGKTFALKKLRELLPPMSDKELLESALIHQKGPSEFKARPYRNPHHTASAAALLGGSLLLPGEVTLSHHGLLFLDEFAEFPRPALESLREPLDEKKITLSRSRGRVELPAHFMLAAATNPCPCGFFFSTHQSCRCLGNAPIKYQQKLSGPLLERFSILLLLDEQAEFDCRGSKSESPLAELASRWKSAFEEDSQSWAEHFMKIQDQAWDLTAARNSTEHDEMICNAFKSDNSLSHLSQRTKTRLKDLITTIASLFPMIVCDWNSEKLITVSRQLRGLEEALQKGVSFLTPGMAEHTLKEPRVGNDIL